MGEHILLLEMIKYYLLKHTNTHKATYIDFFFPIFYFFQVAEFSTAPPASYPTAPALGTEGGATKDTATDGNGDRRMGIPGEDPDFLSPF